MTVEQLIEILRQLPLDLEVQVNDNGNCNVFAIEEVTHYRPNTDLWPDDMPLVVLQVNGA